MLIYKLFANSVLVSFFFIDLPCLVMTSLRPSSLLSHDKMTSPPICILSDVTSSLFQLMLRLACHNVLVSVNDKIYSMKRVNSFYHCVISLYPVAKLSFLQCVCKLVRTIVIANHKIMTFSRITECHLITQSKTHARTS